MYFEPKGITECMYSLYKDVFFRAPYAHALSKAAAWEGGAYIYTWERGKLVIGNSQCHKLDGVLDCGYWPLVSGLSTSGRAYN